MKWTRCASAAAATLLLLAGCGTGTNDGGTEGGDSSQASADPWTELCDTYCSDLASLTSDSFQTCGRAAGASQSACLDAITSKIYEVEAALPDNSQPGISADIDTIRDTSAEYSDAGCDSGRLDGLAGATCTIQSITIEKRARGIYTALQAASAPS
ncbi:hypothetical protein CH292_19425 [Rhodococcus sp. 14-2470-1a]|nr:hypothetical protein CH292_19425 [Rhodococcus sp. 14-2470-1a]